MDLKTLEYKMRDVNGQKIDNDVFLWGQRKKHPIAIQRLPRNDKDDGNIVKFKTYRDAYNYVLPDGRKISKMIDKLRDEDFSSELY